jgi:hypothetical protein
MGRKDINEIAFSVVQRATGDAAKPIESAKAIAGRKGGQKGGVARAATLTQEERTAAGKKAAQARWKKR